jgi:xanthine dehydrogenase small subunit
MRDHIVFHINGREHRVGGAAVFSTLSNWLRYDAVATGTKIVCEEGDCGACTVLIRRREDEDFAAVNSCIQSLCQLDGASIVTVEGLAVDGALTHVQESMVACHGAQCGYCTPGFIMAMHALFETNDTVDEKQVRDGLTGNLCRCTGYEPILKAALAVEGDAASRMRVRYAHVPDAREGVLVEADGRTFCAPATIEEAVAFKAAHPGCTIVQGGTDVGVWITKRAFAAPAMLSLGKIEDLDAITESHGGQPPPPVRDLAGDRTGEGACPPQDGTIIVGANVTLARFERFIETRIPQLFAILNIFGSPQIKNAGTLAGNVANGSPIGDTLPFLFVAGAELELTGTRGTRRVPIDRFYLGYRKFDLTADEIITRILIPPVSDLLRLYKVSRRKDLDISAFTAAIRLAHADGTITAARVAYGGVGPTVLRLPKTEEFLAGKPIRLDTFERAGSIAAGEVTPISDVRGSRDYRLMLAENVMAKCFYDLQESA